MTNQISVKLTGTQMSRLNKLAHNNELTKSEIIRLLLSEPSDKIVPDIYGPGLHRLINRDNNVLDALNRVRDECAFIRSKLAQLNDHKPINNHEIYQAVYTILSMLTTEVKSIRRVGVELDNRINES